ncbi:MAG: Ldh family oxidoreductase [Caldilineaceae bacterium]
MPVVQPDALTAFVAQTFVAAGAKQEHADLVATSLVNTNLTGHDSHGVVRVPQYLMLIQNGDLDPKADPAIEHETSVTARVDGHWALGQVTANFGMRTAIAKAQEHGMATVALINCGHVGRLGEWTLMAADAGLIGLGFCNGGGRGGLVTPHGGAARRLGTDPISASFPLADRPPIMVDFATSAVAEGKIRVARNAGKQVAPGLILDANGLPSIEPDDLYAGGVLLPAAGHKGYGLGLMMEFLGGVFTGRGCSIFPGFQTGNGVLFIVLRADLFQPLEEYYATAQQLVEGVLDVPLAPGSDGVMLPGDPERRMTAARRESGIPIDDATWEQLTAAAGALGVAWQGD